MQQAVMTQPGKIEFHNVEKPVIKPDEVLIQTRRIGVCGSDIHVFHGLHPYTSYPVVQGHEIGAVIAEVGSQVMDFAPDHPPVCLQGLFASLRGDRGIRGSVHESNDRFVIIPAQKPWEFSKNNKKGR